MKKREIKDYSIKFKQLGVPRANYIPDEYQQIDMYSYDRISSLFWNAFCNQLIADGMKEKDAFNLMASSAVRHMLDGSQSSIEKLAQKMATKEFKR